MRTAPDTNVERNIGISGDYCRPWCSCGWEGRKRNLTVVNVEKAVADTWRHHQSGRCKAGR